MGSWIKRRFLGPINEKRHTCQATCPTLLGQDITFPTVWPIALATRTSRGNTPLGGIFGMPVWLTFNSVPHIISVSDTVTFVVPDKLASPNLSLSLSLSRMRSFETCDPVGRRF